MSKPHHQSPPSVHFRNCDTTTEQPSHRGPQTAYSPSSTPTQQFSQYDAVYAAYMKSEQHNEHRRNNNNGDDNYHNTNNNHEDSDVTFQGAAYASAYEYHQHGGVAVGGDVSGVDTSSNYQHYTSLGDLQQQQYNNNHSTPSNYGGGDDGGDIPPYDPSRPFTYRPSQHSLVRGVSLFSPPSGASPGNRSTVESSGGGGGAAHGNNNNTSSQNNSSYIIHPINPQQPTTSASSPPPNRSRGVVGGVGESSTPSPHRQRDDEISRGGIVHQQQPSSSVGRKSLSPTDTDKTHTPTQPRPYQPSSPSVLLSRTLVEGQATSVSSAPLQQKQQPAPTKQQVPTSTNFTTAPRQHQYSTSPIKGSSVDPSLSSRPSPHHHHSNNNNNNNNSHSGLGGHKGTTKQSSGGGGFSGGSSMSVTCPRCHYDFLPSTITTSTSDGYTSNNNNTATNAGAAAAVTASSSSAQPLRHKYHHNQGLDTLTSVGTNNKSSAAPSPDNSSSRYPNNNNSNSNSDITNLLLERQQRQDEVIGELMAAVHRQGVMVEALLRGDGIHPSNNNNDDAAATHSGGDYRSQPGGASAVHHNTQYAPPKDGSLFYQPPPSPLDVSPPTSSSAAHPRNTTNDSSSGAHGGTTTPTASGSLNVTSVTAASTIEADTSGPHPRTTSSSTPNSPSRPASRQQHNQHNYHNISNDQLPHHQEQYYGNAANVPSSATTALSQHRTTPLRQQQQQEPQAMKPHTPYLNYSRPPSVQPYTSSLHMTPVQQPQQPQQQPPLNYNLGATRLPASSVTAASATTPNKQHQQQVSVATPRSVSRGGSGSNFNTSITRDVRSSGMVKLSHSEDGGGGSRPMSNTSTPYKHSTTTSQHHKDPHQSRPSHPSSEHPYFSQPRPLVKPKPHTAGGGSGHHHQYRTSNNTTPNTSANVSSRQHAVSGGVHHSTPPVAAYGSSRLPLDNSALHNLSGLSNSSTSHQADYNHRHHHHWYSTNNSHNQSAVNSSGGFRSENTYGHANRSGNGPRNSAAAASRKSRNSHQHDTSMESSSTAAGVLEGYCSFESMEYMRSIGLL